MRRWIIPLVVAGCVYQLPAGAAFQDPEYTPTGSGSGSTISASVTITSHTEGYLVDGYAWGGGSVSMLCYYFELKDSNGGFEIAIDYEKGPIWPPTVGTGYALQCYQGGTNETGDLVVGDLVVYDPGNPLGDIAADQRALDLARSQVVLPDPTIRTAPPAGAPQLVGAPAWYWLDTWATTSTSATVGSVTATVTATPRFSSWDPGDGSAAVTCEGPGARWVPGVDSADPPCGHLYTHTGDYTLGVTVTWDVSWTTTAPGGGGGPLDPLTTTATIAVHVDEAQAVLT